MTEPGEVLVDLAGWGNRLLIRVLAAPPYPGAADLAQREWRTVRIEVTAVPFAGVVQTVCAPGELAGYRAGLARLAAAGPDDEVRVVLGGGRAAEVTLHREDTVLEIGVTPSGDDPWPRLTYLVPTD